MTIDFAPVTRVHVLAAIDRVRREGVPPRRDARSTLVVHGEDHWAAKYVLGLAYEEATGTVLDGDDYHGGLATAAVLRALGFDVEHQGTLLPGRSAEPAGRSRTVPAELAPVPAAPPAARPAPAGQPAPRGEASMAVSVAVEGGTARGPADTPGRIRLLRRIVDRLCAADRPGNAAFVVLPGGFFRLGEFLGHLPASERRARIAGAGFTPACREAASRLAEIVPGAVVVAGVDTVAGHGEWADQLAVAWDSAGVAGVGRKVFPTATGPLGVEPECRGMVIDAADFDDPGRVVDLPGGRRGVLCACYDGFGVFDPRRRAWPIERLRVGGRIVRWDEPGFDTAWERAVRGWIALVKGVDTALIAIHGFGGGGNSSYWQRHGIATASAALGGGFAVAGAHFSPLPRWEGVQTLCAGGVDRGHLGLGNHRRKESLAPAGNAWLDGALLRWFAVR